MCTFIIIAAVFSIFLQETQSADPSSILCTDDFCLSYEVEIKCPPSDVIKCNNDSLALLLPSVTECNCCETCLMFQKKGEDCINGSPGQVLPGIMCGPKLTCVNKKCVDLDSSIEDPLNVRGNYQCSNGKCHCVAYDSGSIVEIFGTFLEEDLDVEQTQCLCSQNAYVASKMSLQSIPFNGTQLAARCLANGQYDPLQCQDNVCVCVDPNSGVYDETIPKVPLTLLGPDSPLCYDSLLYQHNKKYYRDCEKAIINILRAQEFAEADGFNFLFPYSISCKPDGEFTYPLPQEVKEALEAIETIY